MFDSSEFLKFFIYRKKEISVINQIQMILAARMEIIKQYVEDQDNNDDSGTDSTI